MNGRKMACVGLFASLALVVAGCSKGSSDATDAGSAGSGGASSAAPTKAEGAAAIVVPAGTELTVRLESPVGSKTSNEGDPFEATVTEPVMAGGNVAIPKGASASGVVTQAHAAGHFKGGATLDLVLKSVTINGTS